MEAGEDMARPEGRRKAFRGRNVSKGKRQERVWQVRGAGRRAALGHLAASQCPITLLFLA